MNRRKSRRGGGKHTLKCSGRIYRSWRRGLLTVSACALTFAMLLSAMPVMGAEDFSEGIVVHDGTEADRIGVPDTLEEGESPDEENDTDVPDAGTSEGDPQGDMPENSHETSPQEISSDNPDADIDGQTQYSTLQDALEVVTEGQTVNLLRDVDVAETVNAENKSFTLDLGGHRLNGNQTCTVLHLTGGTVTVKNGEITGGMGSSEGSNPQDGSGNGGGILADGTRLTLSDLTISGCKFGVVSGKGSAVFAENGSLTLNNVKFENNNSHDSTLYVEDSDLVINQGKFTGNEGDANSGLKFSVEKWAMQEHTIDLSGVEFSNNTGGQVIAVSNAKTLSFTNVTVSGNQCSSGNEGGYVEITMSDDSTTDLSNVTITGNEASEGSKSLLKCSGKGYQFKGCKISNNTGFKSIVELSTFGTSAEFDGCEIIGNTAFEVGGINMVPMKATLTLKNTVIHGNVATTDTSHSSGGVYVNGGIVTMESGAVYLNECIVNGVSGFVDWNINNSDNIEANICDAESMKDDTDDSEVTDFAGYYWRTVDDGGTDQNETLTTPGRYYAYKEPGDVAENIDKEEGFNKYTSLAEAVEDATSGDTIRLIVDDPSHSCDTDTINLNKDIILDLNSMTLNCRSGSAFTIESGGKLTVKGSGQITADITVNAGGTLVLDSDAYVKSVTIKGSLGDGIGKVSAGPNFVTEGLHIVLGDNILDNFRNQTGDTADLVLIAKESGAETEAALPHITVEGLDADDPLVFLKLDEEGNIVLHKVTLDGNAVFVGGVGGDDTNHDGLSYDQAVETLEKAKKILEEKGFDTIYVVKNLILGDCTIDLNGKKLARYPSYNGTMLTITGNVTITNTVIDGGGESVAAAAEETETPHPVKANAPMIVIEEAGSSLTLDKGAILQNNNYASDRGSTYGGAVSIGDYQGSDNATPPKLIMKDDSVIQNCHAGHGGGVAVLRRAEFTMDGGVISNNSCTDHSSYGGGVFLGTFPNSTSDYVQMVMNGGVIEGNKAQNGGGIALGESTARPKENGDNHYSLEIHGGTIQDNHANADGGGITVQETFSCLIDGANEPCYIIGNTAGSYGGFGGGGIYVNGGKWDADGYPNGLLQLYNVVISGNKTEEKSGNGVEGPGGGIGGCVTSSTKIYMGKGGAIFSNTEQTGKPSDLSATMIQANGGIGGTGDGPDVYVSEHMLGGGFYNWKWASGENEGESVGGQYVMRGERALDIYSDSSQADRDKAVKAAKVFIQNNHSQGRGGGIGSNGDIIIGEPVSLSVGKILAGENVDRDKQWTFDIYVEGAENREYPAQIFDENGERTDTNVKFDENRHAKVTLKGGQILHIFDLPYESPYTVTEAEANTEGYSTTEKYIFGKLGDADSSLEKFPDGTSVLNVSRPEASSERHWNLRVKITGLVPGNYLSELWDDGALTASGTVTFSDTGEADITVMSGQTVKIYLGSDANITSCEVTDRDVTSDNVIYSFNMQIDDKETAWVEFTNIKTQLNVTKTVTGDGDKDKLWLFRVHVDGAEGSYPSELWDGETQILDENYSSVIFDEGGNAEFFLKDGWTLKIFGLPIGAKYEVTEDEANQGGYNTETFDEMGTIPEDGFADVEFINDKPGNPPPPPDDDKGNLSVTKRVTGESGDREKEWHFVVELSKPINGQYGDMTFKDGVAEFTLRHGEKKTATNLPEGLTYTVTEVEADEDGYSTRESGASGEITDGKNAQATFVNDKPDTPPEEPHQPEEPPNNPTEYTDIPNEKSPKTGDNNWLWVATMGLSGVGFFTLGLMLAKNSSKKKGKHSNIG